MTRSAARIGAIFYALWGLLHIAGGLSLLHSAMAGSSAFLAAQSGNPHLSNSGPMDASSWTFAFFAFLLAGIGLISLIIAITGNWKNYKSGYWVNFGLVFLADLGLVLFLVLPGVLTWSNAWPGPLLFLPAFGFSTWARLNSR
ncbi:MAG: hypothetical protein KDC71_21500 [Acidobacteria bacterium]|nr:hypothetical protein [Acidobacteriota bacterium]